MGSEGGETAAVGEVDGFGEAGGARGVDDDGLFVGFFLGVVCSIYAWRILDTVVVFMLEHFKDGHGM